MSQSLSQILVHIVFSTKNRKHVILDDFRQQLYPYMAAIMKNLGCIVYEIGGTDNHVHIFCAIPNDRLLTEIIGKIKSGSSNWMKKQQNMNDFFWQRGYGVFSVSQSQKPIISNYIKNQIEHHKKFSFEEEFKSMLKKCGINCDEKYLWC